MILPWACDRLAKFMFAWLLLVFGIMRLPVAYAGPNNGDREFVQVQGRHFVIGAKRYAYLGTNLWYAANLGAEGNTAGRARLVRELDRLAKLGVRNLRIMAGTEGPDDAPWRISPSLQPRPGEYNQAVLSGLDFALVEMAKRSMRAVLCLGNYWHWSGGFAQYLQWAGVGPIPYPPPAEGGDWNTYKGYVEQFYTNAAAKAAFARHIEFMVRRVNSISQVPYTDDPTIMSWELANEPDAYDNKRAFVDWVAESARLIKSLDSHHLVISGSEGETMQDVNELSDIDYGTTHIWVQNAGWYNPADPRTYRDAVKKAIASLAKSRALMAKVGKPLVLAEFGIARDLGRYESEAPATHRQHFFNKLLGRVYSAAKVSDELAGANFWAWGGEGRPRQPGSSWSLGDDFTGDPPHEPQGWYSIYDRDIDMALLLKRYAGLLRTIQ